MNYEKAIPQILEKTYKNHEDVSTENLPKVKVKSFLFGKRIIALPFIDSINIKNLSENDIDEKINFEIKLSEFNENFKKIKLKLIKNNFKENPAKGQIISELTTENDLWGRFHKHTRNDIRMAEKSELKIKEINSLQELKKFYRIYIKEMKRFGTPQHSFKFFKNCYNILGSNFIGINCYKNEKIIASIILFLNNNYCYVSFNVSNPNFRNFRPNDLLYWESIKKCIKKNIKYFDIGQIDINPEVGSREENLLKFKRKWLGKEYKKIYFTKGFEYNHEKRDSLKKFRKIWKKLPIFILKIIGPKIISQIDI